MPIELVVPEGATTARLRDAGRSDEQRPELLRQRVRWYLAFEVPSGPGRVETFTSADVGDLANGELDPGPETVIDVFETLLGAAVPAPQRLEVPAGDPAVAIWDLDATA